MTLHASRCVHVAFAFGAVLIFFESFHLWGVGHPNLLAIMRVGRYR
jgi:hypothetical protein